MNFQSEYVPPTYNMPSYDSDMEMLRELTETIRDLNYNYNENIRYHHRILENYNQNMNLLFILLQTIYNHVLQSGRRHTTSADPSFRSRGYRGARSPAWSTGFPRRTSEPSLEMDLSSLILYLFTNGNPTPNGSGARNGTAVTPLTSVQIEQSTEMILYNPSFGERICPISMENFDENEHVCRIRGCRHFFKREHLMRWLQTSSQCPVCRYNLRDFSNNTVTVDPAGTAVDESRIHNEELYVNPTEFISTEYNRDRLRRDISFENQDTVSPRGNSSFLRNPMEELASALLRPIMSSNNLVADNDTQNISQLLTNLLRNQLPAIDASNNLLYTLEIPMG